MSEDQNSLSEREIAQLTNGMDCDPEKLYSIKRFLSLVRRDGDMPDQSNPHYAGLTRCWRWKWKTKGYPVVYTAPKRGETAYRISYSLFKGEIPKGMCVMHRCDNKQCTNPEHLVLGTHAQNSQDAHKRGLVKKGRARMKKGVQSVYVMCKVHNLFSSLEEHGRLNGETEYFGQHPWQHFRSQLETAFQAMVHIHMPDSLHLNTIEKIPVETFYKYADRDAVDELLTQDKNKIALLNPSRDTTKIPTLAYADFVRFEQGETPIYKPLKNYKMDSIQHENYDGSVIPE